MKNVLITGGAGFIGSSIVCKLHENGCNVVVLDNFSLQIHGNKIENSYLYQKILNKCTIINGDVRRKEDWVKSLAGIEYVIHLAAETGTGQSMYEVNRYNDVNIMGLSNLFDILIKREHKIKKIILSSSRSVYGEGMYYCEHHEIVYPKTRTVEDMMIGDFDVKCPICEKLVEPIKTTEFCNTSPVSLYAFTKLAQEKMLEIMSAAVNIPYTIFRYQNVYGPGQSLSNPYTGILSIFSTQLLKNRTINIYEDGLESRDFVYIDDTVTATINALENPQTDNQVINVGSGEKTSVLQVANTLKRLYNSTSQITVTGDFRKGDIRHNIADIEKLKNIAGFEPSYSFEAGISNFVNWVTQQKNDVDDLETSLIEMQNTGILVRGGSGA